LRTLANAVRVDFGRTADDYAAYRSPFPAELFARLRGMGVGLPRQRIVDLGTGPGALARGFAQAGCSVTGVDPAAALLAQARRLDTLAGVTATYRVGRAEDTGLVGGCWDVVSAGQCWHWFDRPRAAQEARRLLSAGGALVICHRDYVVLADNVCAATENLVLRFNPAWAMAGGTGIHPAWTTDAATAGFTDLETFSFDVTVEYTHEAWRGRMRTCNGVGATLPDRTVAEFDAALRRLLAERFPTDPLLVPHRIWALISRAPTAPA
jgi:SAM-dependent methyltransferase